MSGIFITFEGGEGCGKSTQIKLLNDYLNEQGIQSISTREPGGTEIGAELRRILVTGDKSKFDGVAETLLYFADRRIHLTNKIWPALKEGTWVISDRFADSTTAYQFYGHGKKIEMADLKAIYKLAVGTFEPDLTIILDIDPEIGLRRSFSKADGMAVKETRFESIGLEFHQNMRRGFLEIAKENPQRYVVLDANKTIEEMHKEIVELVEQRFIGKQWKLI
ncbi:MAG: dTMP kinase [Alphaproteobacteria bacterium]|nr:dTMP kinase [Alphaproteobacteria bacterium]